MRFKSKKTGGFRVWAVTGVNTVSFAIEADDDVRKGLLGFAVDRVHDGKPRAMPGFKVFPSGNGAPDDKTMVSTHDHPVQSFVWDDFTADDDETYEYVFHPVRGKPGALKKDSKSVSITVKTEALFANGSAKHDVFFNRGVASSQAYERKFGNKSPRQMTAGSKLQTDALEWLSRKLDDGILTFIKSAKKGDALRGCFYEFRYEPVLEEIAKAIDRGVDVSCIVDMKKNQKKDKKTGKIIKAFPRTENLKAIKAAGIPMENIVPREERKSAIQHNKFMVLLRDDEAREVWTGSTNLSDGGIHGQTNVGHWIRDAKVAERFLAYWTLLSEDPGIAVKKDIEKLGKVPEAIARIPKGTTTVFSPRSKLDVLDLYVKLLDDSKRSACITLAFGVGAEFKDALTDDDWQSALTFLLLEKEDRPKKPRKGAKTKPKPFVALNAKNNVYQAWGSYLKGPVYRWAKETNARALELNSHVAYIHSKFLLADPLSADPIVVTGSANFSKASTQNNDENMVIIRGDQRVADIYFTEFNRLFNHYYFRAVHEKTKGKDTSTGKSFSLFLDTTDGWLDKYKPGSLRQKRVDLFASMGDAKEL
jgi:phosphatidylserine/phosphatidylglycerophosphate/cardiolipin synthase-like enzyme